MKTEFRIPMAERRPKAEIRKQACFRLRLASARQVAETFPVRASVFGSRISFGVRDSEFGFISICQCETLEIRENNLNRNAWTQGKVEGVKPKTDGRNPKEIRRPKSESRPASRKPFRFEFRNSDFLRSSGLGIWAKPCYPGSHGCQTRGSLLTSAPANVRKDSDGAGTRGGIFRLLILGNTVDWGNATPIRTTCVVTAGFARGWRK